MKISATTLTCDQAIFTSIRTLTGEGYRIVAASRGLHHDEKQAIIRYSPSHDALCWPATGGRRCEIGISHQRGTPYAAAFYPLPGGRLCVALSCYAGAEHTGRGGQRVYTHNLVFARRDFRRCGYNPFTILRAMADAELTSPQLKPPAVLPELQLAIADATSYRAPSASAGCCTGRLRSRLGAESAVEEAGQVFGPDLRARRGGLGPAWRGYVLQSLLDKRSLIVNVKDGWLELAEALLMGLPGPVRAATSFAAGLRFSVSRCHCLSLLDDDPGVTRSRIAGRSMEYVDPSRTPEPEVPTSAWLSFVERHWSGGDIATLARRTSRELADVGESARERIARIYNEIDAIPQTDTSELLAAVAGHLREPGIDGEAAIIAELVLSAQRTLIERFSTIPWSEARHHCDTILQLRRQSSEGRTFADPLIGEVLRGAQGEVRMTVVEQTLSPS